ncbi:MAG: hypothetical protein ACRC2R_01920 [Xenococcaceae cyanobacterium]
MSLAPTNCMATLGKTEQEAAIAHTFPMFSYPISFSKPSWYG